MEKRIAECINILGRFCGKRDVENLLVSELKNKYQLEQADVMVLFGGSIMCGGDVLATAMKNNVAKKYVIVGGAGHTTEALRIKVHEKFPDIITDVLTEAATKLARAMITRFGMSEKFGMVALETQANPYLGGDSSLSCSSETAAEIDQMVVETVKAGYEKAMSLLEENKGKLHELAKYLYEKETITGEEFMQILNRAHS